jgi:hypothetical protein
MDIPQVAQYLTADEKREYLELIKMFESTGWTILKQKFADLRAGAQAAFDHATTWEQNRVAYGQRDSLDMILNTEEGIEKYFELIATTRVAEQQENLADADRSME